VRTERTLRELRDIKNQLMLAHARSLRLTQGRYLNKGEAIGFVDGLVQQTDTCIGYVQKLEGLVEVE
jgi:hypothetical protein